MKFRITFIISIFWASQSLACDICGCNNGGSFFGILPQSHMQFMGIRYKQQSYDSHISSKLLKTREDFHTVELWGRLYPMKKTQVLFFAPVHQNQQERLADGFVSKKTGLGDLSVLVHYNLINTFTDTVKVRKINHSLLLGFGVKAPTGQFRYDQYEALEVANANFQLGTGSWDIPINAIYTLKWRQSGLNLNAMYKLNGTNGQEYKFANQWRTSVLAFKSIYWGNVNIMPNLGLFGEWKKQDVQYGKRNENTGGGYLAANGGVNVYFGKYALNLAAQVPLSQNLSGGELQIRNGFNVNLSRMF
ncbi:hypothetical protein LAG90_07210 [Marinilongibacter aquaticus]|uniref:hypothetical protein n=1 Tax=Marinilongibacter aquaticus TaxID=2975157 RepID=UPI0021BD99A1|nr:hypothetical protein [Marinilongibacter aquaticus]UBM60431.1 hypothetical protein LAG90_07210 [Marinilongibacter aquaticus]